MLIKSQSLSIITVLFVLLFVFGGVLAVAQPTFAAMSNPQACICGDGFCQYRQTGCDNGAGVNTSPPGENVNNVYDEDSVTCIQDCGSGGGGGGGGATVDIQASNDGVNFSDGPVIVPRGQRLTINWGSSGTSFCTLTNTNGGSSGVMFVSQGIEVIDISHPWWPSPTGETWTITCDKTTGGTITDTVVTRSTAWVDIEGAACSSSTGCGYGNGPFVLNQYGISLFYGWLSNGITSCGLTSPVTISGLPGIYGGFRATNGQIPATYTFGGVYTAFFYLGDAGYPIATDRNYTVTCNAMGGGTVSDTFVARTNGSLEQRPDLIASPPAPTTATVNVAQIYTSTITNQGTAATPTTTSFTNLFQISTAPDGSTGLDNTNQVPGMSSLAAGASANTSKSITFPSVGTWYIRACADADNRGPSNTGATGTIAESNETNNCSMSTPWTAVTVIGGPVPVVSISANPTSGTFPISPTLTWSATNNPTSCTASGGWSGSPEVSGTNVAQTAINTTTNYLIYCTNGNGPGPTDSVTVGGVGGPVPVVSISVSPPSGTAPVIPTLTWSATNSPTSCTASGGWSGSPEVSGTNVAQAAINTTTNYIIYCTNGNGPGPINNANVVVNGINNVDLVAGLVTPTFAIAGIPKNFTSRISNIGTNTTVTGFKNIFQVSTDGVNPSNTYEILGMGALAGGNSADAIRSNFFTTAGSNRWVKVCADNDKYMVGNINEGANEGNNCGAWQKIDILAPGPDLITADPTPITATAGVIAFSAVITNRGNVDAGSGPPIYHVFHFDNNADHAVISELDSYPSSPTITANGGTATLSQPRNLPAGVWYVQACADVNNDINEGTNEGNNCSNWVLVTVSAPAAPDLVASIPSPTTASVGVPVTLTSTITNQGNVGTTTGGGGFTNLFQVSSTSDGSSGVTPYAVAGMSGGLTAGGGNANTFTSVTFNSIGPWWVRACADSTNIVNEGTNEGNNCSSPWQPMTVTALIPWGTITSSPCTVALNAATCNSTLNWNTGNFTPVPGSDPAITRNNPANTPVSFAASGVNVTNAISPGDYTYYVYHTGIVDPLASSSATASCASGTWNGTICSPSGFVPEKDLRASDPTPNTATKDVAKTFTSTITNNGVTATGGGFTNLFQTSADGSTVYNEYPVAGMSALAGSGGHADVSQSIMFPSVATWYVRACADKSDRNDVNGVISESNENNNCSNWTPVAVSAAPVPPTLDFICAPSLIAYGTWSTCYWDSTDTSSCVGTNFDTGGDTSGSAVVTPLVSTTYTVTCDGIAEQQTVTVGGKKPTFKEN